MMAALDGMLQLMKSKYCDKQSNCSLGILNLHPLLHTQRNTVVVGAPFDEIGSVFVYKEVSDNKWELLGDKITPPDGVELDMFGYSVDVDQDSTLVVGSAVSLSLMISIIYSVNYELTFSNFRKGAVVNNKMSAGAAYIYKIPGEV